jgi:hypothetical protein
MVLSFGVAPKERLAAQGAKAWNRGLLAVAPLRASTRCRIHPGKPLYWLCCFAFLVAEGRIELPTYGL